MMSDEIDKMVLESLAAFVAGEAEPGAMGLRVVDRLRDDLAVDSLKLLMVISHVAEQLDLELADFAEVDFHGMEKVSDLIEIFGKVFRARAS